MSCGVDLSAGQPPGLDPSEAETVIAPVLKPDAVADAPMSLGPASTPEPEPTPPPPEPEPEADQMPTDQGGVDVSDMSKSAMFPNDLVDESAPDSIGPGGDYEEYPDEPKKSKKGLIIGCLGCLSLICCSSLIVFGVLYVYPVYIADAGGALDSQWAEMEAASWGEIKLTAEAKVYASNSTGASVLENHASGDKLEYHGFDDSYEFYKVKTGGGTDGYVELMKAEIVFEQ